MTATGDDRRGILFALSSPSGAGKTTLSRRLLKNDKNFMLSVSVTTRPRRPSEQDGKDYYFVSKQRFDELVDSGALLEHAHVFGHFYGTPRAPVEAALEMGHDMLFDVDWQGAQLLRLSEVNLRGRQSAPDLVSVFVLPPSITALETRLMNRAQDSDEIIAVRMARARDEISHWAEYDYVLINDDLETCYSQIEAIIGAERLRLGRQKWLKPHVDALYREFEAKFGEPKA